VGITHPRGGEVEALSADAGDSVPVRAFVGPTAFAQWVTPGQPETTV